MSSNGPSNQELDQLFPVPSLPPSQFSPQRLPGANLESAIALQDVLKDNHKRYFAFLNYSGWHNHITHRALAIYALGGPATIIRDYYKRDGEIQRPAFESPASITEQNFVDHLGDENFYQGYVAFFSEKISEKGAARTVEEFIFSEKYNFPKGSADASGQPEMLARFFSGLVHAMIHIGYGLEFGLRGMVVEGLALTAVHYLRVGESLPPSLFTASPNDAEHIANYLSSLVLDTPGVTKAPTVSKTGGVHVFDIVARILKDERFDLNTKGSADSLNSLVDILAENYSVVREYGETWTVDLNQPGEIERKMEELIWLSSLFYGVGGSTADGFQSDFFLMHMVTSSLFLPSLIAYLSLRSQVLLLRGYLLAVLTWWIIRGRPALNIKSFMTTTSVEPSIVTTPAAKAPLSTETTPTPNLFLPILQSAITHPNDHLVKIQRSFAHFDTLYGKRPAGYFRGTELENAELLDGSIFLRAALLTADHVGWVREGKEPVEFDRKGFYA